MKLTIITSVLAATAVLSGCAVYPAGTASGSVYYDEPGYYRNSPGPLYYEPAPFYGRPPPVYYGPGPVIIDRGHGNWDRDRRGDRDRFDRDGRGPRPGEGRPQQGARPPPPPQAQPTPNPRPGAQNFRYINPDGPQPAGPAARPSGDGNRAPHRND